MKKVLAVLAVMLFAVNVFAGKIVLEGSTTVLPIAQRAAEEYMDANSSVDITVRGGGSGVGINSLVSGTCDIANASRAIKDSEIQAAASKGRKPKAFVVAMDGIAVIVNAGNSVSNLSKKQVMDIYTGKVTNWYEVGGKNEKIVVVSRDSASGTFESFGELALNKQKVVSSALMQASNQAIVTTISKTPGAIGYVGIGYISSQVKAVSIDGVAADNTTVLTGKYPYSRPLFMYTNGEPKGDVKNFMDFVLSADGQKIVEEEGFVPLQ
ncbi:MAG: PstS family phosphate ABC transporter substrate-binding protein [Endomicrobia bacterium]|nr:PstS family phosphate ABC transporter substrate-binding protein [Endomicrobiia bacterium]MCL2799936.1 PstS family phosphate ABC transporter substrate-binding protein [Endomicrobiia bacterium]